MTLPLAMVKKVPPSMTLPMVKKTAIQLAESGVRAMPAMSRPIAPPADAKELSFMIAGAMPFDLDFKQTLLAMRSEAKRVEAVLEYYETILPSLRRAVKARRKSGGNGHV